jgi:His-Xaa-Ser system protein HxsD
MTMATPINQSPSIWAAEGHVCLSVNPELYPVDAAIAAGYRFTDHAFVWLESIRDGGAGYYIFLRPKVASEDLQMLSGAFMNELLDQALRYRLQQQFGGMRTLMVAQAFSEGDLLSEDDEPEPRGPANR